MPVTTDNDTEQDTLFVKHRSPTVATKNIGLDVQEVSVIIQKFTERPSPQVLSTRVAKDVNQIACLCCWCSGFPINFASGFGEPFKSNDSEIRRLIFRYDMAFGVITESL